MRVRVLTACCCIATLVGCSGLDTAMFSQCMAQCQSITAQSEAAFRQCLQQPKGRACSWQVPADYLCHGELRYLPCREAGFEPDVSRVAEFSPPRWFTRSDLLMPVSDEGRWPVSAQSVGSSPWLECTTYQQMTQCYKRSQY